MQNNNHEHHLRERKLNDAIAHNKANMHYKYSMRYMMQKQFKVVSKQIEQNGDIIELGCGVGDFVEHLSKLIENHRLIAIDISPECVRITKDRITSNSNNIYVCVGEAENAKSIAENTLSDLNCTNIILRGLIHHIPDASCLFENIYDLMQPGGKVIVLEGNASCTYRNSILKIADLFGIEHEASQFPHTPPDDIRELLIGLGFIDINITAVPGLFAPLAYLGIGGDMTWRLLDIIEKGICKISPEYFGWWYLMTAKK